VTAAKFMNKSVATKRIQSDFYLIVFNKIAIFRFPGEYCGLAVTLFGVKKIRRIQCCAYIYSSKTR